MDAAQPLPGTPLLGTRLELEVGAPAHGGHCVARTDGGKVVLVRHALPGELVRALITEEHSSYCRADAVEVLRASPERVAAPCPHAGPGRCGGCDWQHASGPAQRAIKLQVVREQFARLATLDVSDLLTEVEALPPADDPGGLLGWRTRITYAVDAHGTPGLHRYRSHEVERLNACPLGVAGVGDSPALRRDWPGLSGVEVVRGDEPATALLGHRPGGRRGGRGRRPPDRVTPVEGPQRMRHRVLGREFEVDAAGFWQVHPAAAATFTGALIEGLRPNTGERALDLYCGAGLFTAALADAVGTGGAVVGVESSAQAVADAEANLAGLAQASVHRAKVGASLVAEQAPRPDLVVLDPPRAGAGAAVMHAITGLRPRAIGYVACDPAALARDVAAAAVDGWRLVSLRAFDAFPMTHHVECVALLEQTGRT